MKIFLNFKYLLVFLHSVRLYRLGGRGARTAYSSSSYPKGSIFCETYLREDFHNARQHVLSNSSMINQEPGNGGSIERHKLVNAISLTTCESRLQKLVSCKP